MLNSRLVHFKTITIKLNCMGETHGTFMTRGFRVVKSNQTISSLIPRRSEVALSFAQLSFSPRERTRTLRANDCRVW